jgi:two-component system, OmpR family, sensor histidine kinase BaeS
VTEFALHDLAQIAHDATDSMTARAGAANLRLSCRIDQPMIVRCDADRIRQVIDNVLENALRYTAAPGEILVTGKKGGGFATLVVDDTAPAPPADALPHLFERFYRAEKSRSRSDGGSGLGLSICDAIIRAQGGTMTAEMSQMGGLRVAFSLPDEGSGG